MASLGANRKEKATGEVTARVLFDGTHGIDVNRRTRVRDQERGPIASDIKRVLREKAKSQYHSFALTRRHPSTPADTHRPPRTGTYWALQIHPGGWVYFNTVGTFGVASASYWWSRVAGAVGRLSQTYLVRRGTDDYQLDASGPSYREAIICFFVLCSLLGVPLSWSKTSGGDTISWVGFEILHKSHSLGISERRSQQVYPVVP